MELEEKSARLIRAEEKVKLANDELEKVKKEEKKRMRKVQDAHKYMMGGTVARFFPRCYSFNKLEMYRIISYAFSNPSVQSFIENLGKQDPDNLMSTTVTDMLMADWGISTEELHSIALENLENSGIQLKSLNGLLS